MTKKKVLLAVGLTAILGLASYCYHMMCVHHWLPAPSRQTGIWLERISASTRLLVLNTKELRTIEIGKEDRRFQEILQSALHGVESESGYPAESLPRRCVVVFHDGERGLVAQYNGKHLIINGYHFHFQYLLEELFH